MVPQAISEFLNNFEVFLDHKQFHNFPKQFRGRGGRRVLDPNHVKGFPNQFRGEGGEEGVRLTSF